MAHPWQPQGHCHPFEGAVVERIVPAVSGVYGLHTRRQQLFIGEAADLREALLLHRKEAEKLFRGQQPSYFSFEVCETNLRASRAQALIAEFRPSIQTLQLLSLATLPPAKSERKATEDDTSKEKMLAPIPQWPEAPTASEPDAAPQPTYFSRSQLVTLGMSFVITAAAAGFFGFIAGQKIAERRQTALQLAAARRPVLAYLTNTSSRAEAVSEDTAADTRAIEGERLAENTTAVPPLKVVSAIAQDGDAPSAKMKKNLEASALNVTQPDTAESKPVTSPAAKKDLTANTWSVQISATKDQSAAQFLQDKLKSKGFDAFIVEAEINSALWYRVRVGRFSTNQEAEKTRQDLQSKENLASAFVTGK
jgi:cell division septation protein DedD